VAADTDSVNPDKLISDNAETTQAAPGHDENIQFDNAHSDKWVSDNTCATKATIAANQRAHGPFLDLIMYLAPTTKKRFNYCVTHGLYGPHQLLVVHQTNDNGTPGVRVLIPPDMRATLIQLYHDKLLHHSGMFKIVSKIRELYVWPGLYGDVTRYISNCEACLST
jgi:hypothetical protein